MGTSIVKTLDLCAVSVVWAVSALTITDLAWRIVISVMCFVLFINTMRLHSISTQCEADSETLYDYVFGLQKSRDCLVAQNAALARLISRRNTASSKAMISKKRRNSTAVDLRECVATRIVSQGIAA